MHSSAMNNGAAFFACYADSVRRAKRENETTLIVEIGSQNVNGSLRDVAPEGFDYIGVDFVQGEGVDIVLQNPYKLPFADESADIVVSSSVFEHSEMFWLLFLEILRILKPHGLFYLNAPSNGLFHRFPVDCWRFYPDSGKALANWAQREGTPAVLLESYTSAQIEYWNDFVAVFLKDRQHVDCYPRRIIYKKQGITNGAAYGHDGFLNPELFPEDIRNLKLLSMAAKGYEKGVTGQATSYRAVYEAHNGYISHKMTHYPFVYDQILKPRLDTGKPLRLLEIGVQNGGSLENWKKYLPPGSEIHGVDINENCLQLTFPENVYFHLGSASDHEFMNRTFVEGMFDIVIDDGSHICSDVMVTFLNLFPRLAPGGIYIAEDLCTSYWSGYGGGFRRDGASIEFFKSLVDAVNLDHIPADVRQRFPDFSSWAPDFRAIIASVSFYDSVCAVTKFYSPKTEPFLSVITGDTIPVAPFRKEAFLEFPEQAKEQFLPPWTIRCTNQAWNDRQHGGILSSALDAVEKMYCDSSPEIEQGEMSRSETLKQIVSHFESGAFQTAEQLARRLCQENPADEEALRVLAQAVYRQMRVEEAVALMKDVLNLNPMKSAYHNDLGAMLIALERWPEAEAACRMALALNPSNLDAKFNLDLMQSERE